MNGQPGPHTVVLMPAHNEAATIAGLVAAVAAHGLPLVVDDASSDGTGDLARAAGAHVLALSPNRGYARALDAGFAEAARLGAEVVVTFDADGQFAPELLGRLLRPIREGWADLVLGTRPAPARLGEAAFNAYSRLRFGVGDALCGLKAYRLTLYRAHGRFDGGRSVGTELALSAIRRGARFATVPVPVRPRASGAPRFGQGWRANRRLLGALALAVRDDLARCACSRRPFNRPARQDR